LDADDDVSCRSATCPFWLILTHINRGGDYEQKETKATKFQKTVIRYLCFLLYQELLIGRIEMSCE
jgi:hypothetical protein